jgi:hypothetical protein
MNFGFWNFYPAFNQNRMFTQSVQTQGHDWAAPSRLLGRTLQDLGHQVATLDMKPLKWFDRIFFNDLPTPLNSYLRALQSIAQRDRDVLPTPLNGYLHVLKRMKHPDLNLIICEPTLVRPDSYRPAAHRPFRRVLTWKRDLWATDPEKYIPFHLVCMPEPRPERRPFAERKLCCLIQSYMILDKPASLFAERIRAVRWFEANAPRDFDLMGTDWDRILLPGVLSRGNFHLRWAYRRVWPLTLLKFRRYPSFIGPNVKGKHLTMPDYRFCLAYENSVEQDYISEKLFDCFYGGCVPVYYGAPNATDYIPANTFIDKRRFSYEELHRYLSTMSEREYNGYLQAAEDFLNSPAARPWTPEGYVELFVKNFAS